MDQKLSFCSHTTYMSEVEKMQKQGYYIKQITSGEENWVWILFEKIENSKYYEK